MIVLIISAAVIIGAFVLSCFVPDDYEIDPEEERRHDEELNESYRRQRKREQDIRNAVNTSYYINNNSK